MGFVTRFLCPCETTLPPALRGLVVCYPAVGIAVLLLVLLGRSRSRTPRQRVDAEATAAETLLTSAAEPATLFVCTKCRRQSSKTTSVDEDVDEKVIRTGQILYEQLRDNKEITSLVENGQLILKPGNCIAYTHRCKFAYQFGTMDESAAEDIEDIASFAKTYAESTDGYSKSRGRPQRLRSTVLARIPPLEGESSDKLTGEMKNDKS